MIETSTRSEDLMLASDHPVARLLRPALIVGVAALGLAAVGAFLSPQQFFRSYLVAFLFWCGLALGSMAILMLHHITGGMWGVIIRRTLESATRTLPLLAVLFLPLALGVSQIYEWANPEHVAHDLALQHKSFYLNVPFFLGRAVLYFAIWIVLMLLLNRWSLDQDRGHTPALGKRLQYLSRGGLLLYSLTMTFAAVDWVMSLEPHWFSTIYGMLLIAGQVLSAFAFAILMMTALSEQASIRPWLSANSSHDLGKLMLGFVMIWSYFSFSQFLIIWSGNLPEETPWYLSRLHGGWQYIGIGLIIFHFALPLLLLLSRSRKRDWRRLGPVALLVLAARALDLVWMVVPAYSPADFTLHWLDLVTFLGVGGLWLAMFAWQLGQRPLLPVRDPELA